MADTAKKRRLGGREATSAQVDGAYAISVGKSKKPLPIGWDWTLLTDVARLESGHTPSRRHPEYWGGEIPWIGIRDATGNHGRTIESTNENTNELGIANSAARILPINTVCLSRTASVGYVVVMGRPMATSQDFVNWVCSDRLDFRFLKYALIAEGKTLLKFADGSVHQTIYFPEVKAFHIALPPLREQRLVADVLSALDDKIELNRRMNETLEAMAQAVFRDWFVDFGPVRRKMEGATDPVKIMGGVTTDTDEAARLANLFPATLADNGLPEGWEEISLEELARQSGGIIQTGPFGSQLHQSDYREAGIPVIMPANLTYSEVIEDGIARVAEATADRLDRHKLRHGDIVYGRRGDIGRKALVTRTQEGWLCGTGCLRVSIRSNMAPPTFLFFSLAVQDEWLRSRAVGATMPNLNTSLLGSIPIISPGAPLAISFEKLASVLLQRVACGREENQSLAAMRDLLLPKLMSGEIRLKDAEKIAEAAE